MSFSSPDLTAVAAKVVVASAAVPAAGYIVPMWGASIFSFGLAAIGAIMSYAWDQPERDRRVLVFKTLSVTLFSVALVVVLPDLAKWDLSPTSEPPLAFLIATFGRHIIAGVKDAAPAIGRGIASFFQKKDQYGGGYDDNDYSSRRDRSDRQGSNPTDFPPEDDK